MAIANAARHPDQVQRIVLIGMPNFGTQNRAYRYMRKGPVKFGYLYTNVALTMIACVLTRRVFGRLLPYLLTDIPREVAEDLVKHTWRSSTSSLWEVVYRYDVAVDFNRLPERINTLFIHGNQDVMAPVQAIGLLLANCANGVSHVLDGGDHHPFLRDPETCLKLIDKFINVSSTHNMNLITT